MVENERRVSVRDSVARALAMVALLLALGAAVYAWRATQEASEALQEAGDTTVIEQPENTDDPESNPQTNPDNTGTDDAGGAGTGVNNTGAD